LSLKSSPVALYKEFLQNYRNEDSYIEDPKGIVIVPLSDIREPLVFIDKLGEFLLAIHLNSFVGWAERTKGVNLFVGRIHGNFTFHHFLVTDFWLEQLEIDLLVNTFCLLEQEKKNNDIAPDDI
jgi:hypothetical protein